MKRHKKAKFKVRTLHRQKQLPLFGFARRRYSFWVATFSLFAFVMGNMVGQHGWYAFWHSVLGGLDDSAVIFTGTVSPIEYVPDYKKWATYGGNGEIHTYRMVPNNALLPMPAYDPRTEKADYEHSSAGDVYSIGHMGSYETGSEGDGSHAGIDIRVPIGTPVRAIANGVVERVVRSNNGFGNYVVIRHANIPQKGKKDMTTIWSIYAHLDSVSAVEGTLIGKAEQIGLSGMSGFATGPHLHFQIDNEDAPYHPYWPFTASEASEAGFSFAAAINAGLHQKRGYDYTISPMEFVQAHRNDVPAIAQRSVSSAGRLTEKKLTSAERLALRRERRLVAYKETRQVATLPAVQADVVLPAAGGQTEDDPVASSSLSSVSVSSVSSVSSSVSSTPAQTIARVEIRHDGSYRRSWENVTLTLRADNDAIVLSPSFDGYLYLRPAFGDAEFRPERLTSRDFKNGEAVVHVLPRGSKRALVIDVRGPYEGQSTPMEYTPFSN